MCLHVHVQVTCTLQTWECQSEHYHSGTSKITHACFRPLSPCGDSAGMCLTAAHTIGDNTIGRVGVTGQGKTYLLAPENPSSKPLPKPVRERGDKLL